MEDLEISSPINDHPRHRDHTLVPRILFLCLVVIPLIVHHPMFIHLIIVHDLDLHHATEERIPDHGGGSEEHREDLVPRLVRVIKRFLRCGLRLFGCSLGLWGKKMGKLVDLLRNIYFCLRHHVLSIFAFWHAM